MGSASKPILLVEDYKPNVLVATTYLEQFGYDCDVASNGLEAVQKVKETEYAVVLMDVQMGVMDGFEATRAIRSYELNAGLRASKIIGMTAHALSGDKEKCLNAGMDDYIAKPFNPDELHEKLNKIINGVSREKSIYFKKLAG